MLVFRFACKCPMHVQASSHIQKCARSSHTQLSGVRPAVGGGVARKLQSPQSQTIGLRRIHTTAKGLRQNYDNLANRSLTNQVASSEQAGAAMMNRHVDPSVQAGILKIQNMFLLNKQLKTPVAYKTYEVTEPVKPLDAGKSPQSREFAIVVHVYGDFAFKKYLQHCSLSDLMLFRGLLLKVRTTPDINNILSAEVQQAFLPKFENEGQDHAVADAIVSQADQHYVVVTIKHSGSLVTLSGDGFAAKNSINNVYTAGAATLLAAHFSRVHGPAAVQKLAAFMNELRDTKVACSFEMVTAAHGHHGQMPAAEYLVTTSVHGQDATGCPAFLPWREFIAFCLRHSLPVNDTWLIAGRDQAQAARDLLDNLAISGGPTKRAIAELTQLVEAAGCVHLAGTYPHEQWQGSRIEGFVIAQGQHITAEEQQFLCQLHEGAAAQVLHLTATPEPLRNPYATLAEEVAGTHTAKGVAPMELDDATEARDAEAAAVAAACAVVTNEGKAHDALLAKVAEINASWLPKSRSTMAHTQADIDKLHKLIYSQEVLSLSAKGLAAAAVVPHGAAPVYSRLALSRLSAEQIEAAAAAAAALAQAPGGPPEPPKHSDVQACLRDITKLDAEHKAAPAQGEEAKASVKALEAAKSRLLRLAAGEYRLGGSLRYKKKLLMWNAPAGPESSGEVGYCMMTFVIRNGLPALKLGTSTYLGYAANLACNWGLTAAQVAQVVAFAGSWADWVAHHGGAGSIASDSYLLQAEPFVRAFLASGCNPSFAAPGGIAGDKIGPRSRFQGVLVLLDVPEERKGELVKALAVPPAGQLDSNSLAFSNITVQRGSVLTLPHAGQDLKGKAAQRQQKALKEFLGRAAPYMHLVVQRSSSSMERDTKRPRGNDGIISELQSYIMGARGAASAQQRTFHLMPNTATDAVVEWLGEGSPLPPLDPAFICCFVAIPGCGKTALTDGLAALLEYQPSDSNGTTSSTAVGEASTSASGGTTVLTFNSDTLKSAKKNYWAEVAAAAASHHGSGHRQVVVADKNLVNSPPGNMARVLGTLHAATAETIAIVPVCRGLDGGVVDGSEGSVASGGDVVDAPETPFPLELVALCMLRVLNRRNHEGGLDGASLDKALRVVASFVSFFKRTSLPDLLDTLRGQFTHVVQLEVMRAPARPGSDVNMTADGSSDSPSPVALPAPLLRLISEGVSELCSAKGFNHDLGPGWEGSMRKMLEDPAVRAAIEALQLPIDEVRANLASGVRKAMVSAPIPMARPPQYIAVAGLDPSTLDALVRSTLPQELLQGYTPRPSPHVTMWHNDNAKGPVGKAHGGQTGGREVRDALLAATGEEVLLEVLSIDYSPQVTAARVQLVSGPEPVLEHAPAYPHITLILGPGAHAKDAGSLQQRLEQAGAASGTGEVRRFDLPQPLQLRGQLLPFEYGSGGLAQAGGAEGRATGASLEQRREQHKPGKASATGTGSDSDGGGGVTEATGPVPKQGGGGGQRLAGEMAHRVEAQQQRSAAGRAGSPPRQQGISPEQLDGAEGWKMARHRKRALQHAGRAQHLPGSPAQPPAGGRGP